MSISLFLLHFVIRFLSSSFDPQSSGTAAYLTNVMASSNTTAASIGTVVAAQLGAHISKAANPNPVSTSSAVTIDEESALNSMTPIVKSVSPSSTITIDEEFALSSKTSALKSVSSSSAVTINEEFELDSRDRCYLTAAIALTWQFGKQHFHRPQRSCEVSQILARYAGQN